MDFAASLPATIAPTELPVNTCIALFRGINVGGKNVLPKKQLVAILEALGAQSVQTYIQSGNAVFQSMDRDCARFAASLTSAIQQGLGFASQALVFGRDTLAKAIGDNPYPDVESGAGSLHFGFLFATPPSPDLRKLDSLRSPTERFHLAERVFYLHAPDGVGRSRLAASAERLLGVPMTDRNGRTVAKIMAMAMAMAMATAMGDGA